MTNKHLLNDELEDCTVKQWAQIWLDVYKKGSVSYPTYKNYKVYVENHIIPELGELNIRTVMPYHIISLLGSKKDMSVSAQNHIRIALKGIFNSAIENNICTTNPYIKFPIVKTKESFAYFNLDEVINITKYAPSHKYGHYLLILIYTGLRLSELLALRWQSINMNERIIYITEAVKTSEQGRILGATKTYKDRKAGIQDNLHIILDNIPKESDLVIPGERKRYLSMSCFHDRYYKVIDYINSRLPKDKRIRRLSPHKCRHTFGTFLLRSEANMRAVQTILGHSSIKTTEKYTHIDEEDIKINSQKLVY